MNYKDKMPMWRKVLIATCSLTIVSCLVLLGNINNFITNEESNRNTITVIFEADNSLKPLLELNEVSKNEYNRFIRENKDILKKYRRNTDYLRACHILYNNRKFKQIFGQDVFDSLNDGSEESYERRCVLLKSKVVNDAFSYLYSPYTKEGFRDNNKGLGADWEEYNQMSIPDKEEFIRSDFRHKYEVIVEKEETEQYMWGCLLFSITIISCLCISCIVINKLGKKNLQARRMSFYWIACLFVSLIIMTVGAITKGGCDALLAWLGAIILPSIILFTIVISFLAKKSTQDYYVSYLIPEKLCSILRISHEYRKRLLMIFLIYPFFFIVPIPIVGLFVFVCYIIPVLIILGITWIILWIREGKKMENRPKAQNDRARLYCRHCGKLIDADSDYCRYCGKKL